MLKSYTILILLLVNVPYSFGQGRSATWCFGDSAGIQFTSGGIVGITTVLQSYEASASISDTSGNLLLYAGSIGGNNIFHANIYNNLNQQLLNGDSIISTSSITQGLLFLPFFNNNNKYLLFSIGFVPNVFPFPGLFSSTIDISSGIGVVSFKNQIIDTAYRYNEKMITVKHGNGRDWWLINHEHNSDRYIIRLIQNDTINTTNYQNIGSYLAGSDAWGQMSVNPTGNKIAIVGSAGSINVFDFDRCSGLLSNFKDLSDTPLPGFDRYYGASISTQNLFYYSTYDSIWQVDLNSSNPFQSRLLVYSDQIPNVCLGQQLLGPNNKIYIPNVLTCGGPVNMNDSLNTHLTVIDQPDSIGMGCNVLPYFQPVGGGHSYYGLPNMPNYDLGPLAGSPCDTLTSIHSKPVENYHFEIIPNPVVNEFKVSLSNKLKPENYFELQIFNSNGQIVYENIKYKLDNKIIFSNFSAGLYAIRITKNGQQWYSKFIKL